MGRSGGGVGWTMTVNAPSEDRRSWVLRCPACGWEIEVIVNAGERASDSYRPTLRCRRTADHVDEEVSDMNQAEAHGSSRGSERQHGGR